MAVICTCDELGIPNTGFDCFLDPAVATGIWLVPYFDGDGNVYTIDCASSPFDKTFFDGLVNEADKSKRLYPLPAVDNVEDVRADSPTIGKFITRLTLSLAASKCWTIKTTDVKSAFLQSDEIEREIFLKPPDEASCFGK